MMKMCKHASDERYDRIAFIVENIGAGEPMLRRTQPNGRIAILTNTGIMIIVTDENLMITMFIPTLAQVRKFYTAVMNTNTLPDSLFKQVVRNQKFSAKFEKMMEG